MPLTEILWILKAIHGMAVQPIRRALLLDSATSTAWLELHTHSFYMTGKSRHLALLRNATPITLMDWVTIFSSNAIATPRGL